MRYLAILTLILALTLLDGKIDIASIRSVNKNRLCELAEIESELKKHGDRINIENLVQVCKKASIKGHLAILTQPSIDRIIAKEKTIESRFSKVCIPPFKLVNAGDVLFLKESSGPILAIAIVERVDCRGPLSSGEADAIMQEYNYGLMLDDAFRRTKQGSKYSTLMHLGDVLGISPIKVSKNDRRSWIVLNHDTPNRLF